MKWVRIVSLVVLAAFFSICPVTSSLAQDKVGGFLVTLEGKQIVVDEFIGLLDSYTCKYEGAPITIPMKRIRSLKIQDSGVTVTTTNGMIYNVLGGMVISIDDYLKYTTVNPITGDNVQASIDPMLVEKVVFGRKVTDLKKCPVCGRTFPGQYLYCPYDKSPLMKEKHL